MIYILTIYQINDHFGKKLRIFGDYSSIFFIANNLKGNNRIVEKDTVIDPEKTYLELKLFDSDGDEFNPFKGNGNGGFARIEHNVTA